MHRPQTRPPALRTWLLEELCPYWCARIVDPQGGFFEALNAQGQALPSPARTVLNQARLTYVFSHATVLGGGADLRNAADHGFAFLQKMAMPQNRSTRWPRSTDAHGQVLDQTCDAYDHAFVIFAMAWYHRATGSQEALNLGEQAYGFMQNHLADIVRGGFFEEHPFTNKLPRRQNPHMHLLEAVLAMHAATQAPVWLERAAPLIALFQNAFYDTETGSLAEYFDVEWQHATDLGGTLREPGHQFEWVWLLQQYMQATGAIDLTDHICQLFQFGARHGLNPAGALAGAVFDAVNKEGVLLAGSKLMWPQTEYIKACVARFDATQHPSYRDMAFVHWDLVRTHFFHADGANWTNHLGPDGLPLVQDTPSRVLYHVVLAVSELARLETRE